MHPESLMMSYGYDAATAEEAIKMPLYQTSTFEFKTAEEGKAFFQIAQGLKQPQNPNDPAYIYSRINNPNLDVLEKRLALYEQAETGAFFESGMAAISTMLLTYLRPGDVILCSSQLYGGTDYFIKNILPDFGVQVFTFSSGDNEATISNMIQLNNAAQKLKFIYIETPSNPTNDLVDIEMCASVAQKFSSENNKVWLAVDNTYLGPLWQKPLQHGADFVIYSATKYIGGHSDVIAGACLGKQEAVMPVKKMRTYLGTPASPFTSWLLLRSLETLALRMQKQAANAEKVASFLSTHPKVQKLYYLGAIPQISNQYKIKEKQCLSNGAMIAFEVIGGEAEAFSFLNKLKLVKLAVSLGSTESLAEHPATMTHASVSEKDKMEQHISPNLIRLSVGVENADDIISDLQQALQ